MKKQQINGEPLEFTGNVMMKQFLYFCNLDWKIVINQ